MQKFLPNWLGKTKRYYGLNQLDRKLESWLNYDGGYFIELGANNGLDQSNTAYFEKSRGWTGLLIEPTPHRFLECRNNRKGSHVSCCACVGYGFTDRFVEIEYANLMTIARGLASDIHDVDGHLSRAIDHLPKNEVRFTFGALARPLSDVMTEAGSPTVIDLLSLDVEGAEIEVLNGVDFDKYRFRYMVIECRDLDPLKSFLEKRGYTIEASLTQHDYLFRGIDADGVS